MGRTRDNREARRCCRSSENWEIDGGRSLFFLISSTDALIKLDLALAVAALTSLSRIGDGAAVRESSSR